ncbi:MAG: HEAT repeat domain-containing protein [Planctomycetota bacterium]
MSASVGAPPAWALPGLLRGLTSGHPSLRAQVLRLLERYPASVLEAEPAATVFRQALSERAPWAKGVGGLVARRGLASYAPLLVELLRHAELREAAEGWLRERTLVRPLDALVALVRDAEAPLEGRLAALRLLKKQPLLDPAALLPALARPELQPTLLEVLRPACDRALVARAVAANQAPGEALLARRRTRERGDPSPTLLERLLGVEVDAVGVVAGQHDAQRGFSEGVARIAAAAGDPLLARFAGWAAEPGVGEVLRAAWREHGVREVAREVVRRPAARSTAEVATLAALVGDLAPRGDRKARRWLAGLLPEVGRPAAADQRAAIVALGQLGDERRLAPLLDAALAGLLAELGRGGEGVRGHATSFDPCLRAAGHLGAGRFADVALDALRSTALAPALQGLPQVLAQLRPLELTPTLETVLAARPKRTAPWRLALETARLTAQRDLLPLATETAGEDADLVGAALVELLRPELLELAERLCERLGDAACERLLEATQAQLGPDAGLRLARRILARGAGGPQTQRRALRAVVERGGDVLAVCASLFRASDMSVRRAALEEALAQGLLARPGELGAEVAYDLLLLVRDAIDAGPDDRVAAAQVRAVLDALLPQDGAAGLDAEATRALRARIREAGLWSEAASFHALHRDLLQLGARGAPVGLLHGALLSSLGRRRFRHPLTGVVGPYPGPLPRFEAARAATREPGARPAGDARWLEEGLFDVVVGPGYLRPPSVVVGFLDAGSPRVRAAALALLDRPAVLAHAEPVLARLEDPDAPVRVAAVELLRRHELARFAGQLDPLLGDPDPGVQLAAARTLAAWGQRESLGHLVSFLDSPDQERRREAVTCLRRFAPDDLRGALAPLVGLARPRATAGVLAALRPGRLPDDPALRARLFEVAARGTGALRAAALRLLPDLMDDERLREVVPLLSDAHPAVRQAAAAVLRRPAGRKLAPAVAELAASAQDSGLRLELLGLLGDLDQPEAARGVVPLLLDDDPRVRGEVRAALAGKHAYSLAPELEGALELGLAGGGGPQALAELLQLLDLHTEAAEPFVQALRCEERAVWEAALAALARRKSRAHHPRLLELLAQGLPPALATLAIDAVGALPEAGEPLLALASKGPAPTVRRKALLSLAAHSLPGDRVVTQLLGEAEARAKGLLEVHAADAARERTARGGRSKQRPPYELVQARATLGTCGRVRLARVASLRELGPTASALPEAVWRTNSTLRGVLHELAARLVADAPPRTLEVLGLPSQASLPAVAWLARDRVAPERFLDWLEELDLERPPEAPDYAQARRVRSALRAGVVARFLAGRLSDASPKSALARSLDMARWQPRTWEQFLLAAAEHGPSELSELLGSMVASAGRELSGLPARGYALRRRQQSFLHYAQAALRLEERVPAKAFAQLCDEPELLGRLHAAQGDAVDLVACLERTHGESEVAARAEVLTLLGEAGVREARELLPPETVSSQLALRVAAGCALGLLGDPDVARAPLAALLGDGEPVAVASALVAVGLLRDPAHLGAVRLHLGAEDVTVALAAVRAARALPDGERALRPELLGALARFREHLPSPSLVGAFAPWPRLAPYLVGVGEGSTPGALVRELHAALRAGGPLAGDDLAAFVAACRERALPDPALAELAAELVPEGALDALGALLGDEAPGTVCVALSALAAREHAPALAALPALCRDPRPTVVAYALGAVGKLGRREHLALVQELIADEALNPGIRAMASSCALDLLEDPAARLALLEGAAGLRDGAPAGPAWRQVARHGAAKVEASPALARWLLEELSAGLFRTSPLPEPSLDPDSAERAFTAKLPTCHLAPQRAEPEAEVSAALASLLALDPARPERSWALRMAQHAAEDGWRGPTQLGVLRPWLQGLEAPARVAWLVAYGQRSARHAQAVTPWLLADDPTAAARLLPQVPLQGSGRNDAFTARATAVLAAAAQDPEPWRSELRALLLTPETQLRALARAALGDPRWEDR